MTEDRKGIYNTVTIQAAIGGWIVKTHGKPHEVFSRWESVVNKIKNELTSAGDKDAK